MEYDKSFLSVDGGDQYSTDRFLDIKLPYREQMHQKLTELLASEGAIHSIRLKQTAKPAATSILYGTKIVADSVFSY